MKVIKVKVKTLWQGKIGIRDKYLNQAIQEDADILIEHAGRTMEIPRDKIDQSIKAKSETSFFDRYSTRFHYLYYFDWKPDEQIQLPLF